MMARLLLVAVVVAVVSGCATRPRPSGTIPPAELPTIAPEETALTPEAYLVRAASYDQLAVRAWQLAEERSSDARLRQLARQLGEEHRGLAGQLSLAGRRLNLLPSKAIMPVHQRWLDELTAAEAFDPAFLRLMRRVHQNSHAVHAAFARFGSSPTLRLVARNAVDVERRHWALLSS